jgi:hypothetical protein
MFRLLFDPQLIIQFLTNLVRLFANIHVVWYRHYYFLKLKIYYFVEDTCKLVL